MEKIKINLTLVLPNIPNEQDACVDRIINELKGRQGIQDVHLIAETANNEAQLCFHYDPKIITVDRVKNIANNAGAVITERYCHLLIEVKGFRHQRQTRLVETTLHKKKGVLSVSASATGVISIEFDKTLISESDIYAELADEGLSVEVKKDHHLFKSDEKKHTHHHEHKHEKSEGIHHHEEGHTHGGMFGENTELIFSLICGSLLGIGFVFSFYDQIPPYITLMFYVGAYFFGGFYTTKEAVQTVLKGGFEIDFLMLVAAIGAAILGNWAEGSLLLFLFSLGHALEHFAMDKARKSITALTALTPKTAILKTGEQTSEVGIEMLRISDIILVKPNTKIPADGVIIKGNSSVNQAPITGESIPVDKTAINDININIEEADKVDAEHKVFAGTINGNMLLEIKVIKEASDSTIARLVKMVNEAQTQKSPTQQLTDKVEKYYVPAVLVLVLLLCFAFLVIEEPFSRSFYRAMSVLVAASPCALAISTPSAVLSGVARAARAGVLVKGGKPLEDMGSLKAMAFDKTGTLTEGKPKLTHIIVYNGMSEEDFLKIVVAVEALSDHPIAKAIVNNGLSKLKDKNIPVAANIESVLGKGIKAGLQDEVIYIGNLALFLSLDDIRPEEKIVNNIYALEEQGNTTMLVRRNGEYIGIVAVMDTPREEAGKSLFSLKEIGINRMIMLTGDNQKVAEAVAREVGITEAWGGLLPTQKVEAIQRLMTEEKKVAMVGDGVNDAPAMANSTIGIAMGAAGSDVVLETADVALMGDKLSLLPFAIGLSRKAKIIIRQNLVMSLGVVAILVPLTILDIATIGPAVIAHEGSTLVVVFNALRLLMYRLPQDAGI